MPIPAWLRAFFVYEARGGGAVPSPQLFPFAADSDTTTDEADNANIFSTIEAVRNEEGEEKSESEAKNVAHSTMASPTNVETRSCSDASASSDDTTPPPPPSSPPPTAAITTVTKKVVRVRDVGCSTPASSDPDDVPRFYSRYVFLHTVTGLQLLWAYYCFALWNYFAHIRWYGASMAYLSLSAADATRVVVPESVKATSAASIDAAREAAQHGFDQGLSLHQAASQWLAVAYLAFALAGLVFTVSAVLYVCVVNTPWHVRAAWPHSQLFMKACCPDPSLTASDTRAHDEGDLGNDPFCTYGPVQRGVSQLAKAAAAAAEMGASASPYLPGNGWDAEAQSTNRELLHHSSSRVYSHHPYLTFAPHPAPGLYQRRQPPLPLPSVVGSSVAPLSFTQPQFLFPLRQLTALDRVAAAAAAAAVRRTRVPAPLFAPDGEAHLFPPQQQLYSRSYPIPSGNPPFSSSYLSASNAYRNTEDLAYNPYPFRRTQPSQPSHRGDPKAPLLWCACPLVIVLVVFDFMVIHGCRARGWPVRLMQGLTPALGLLLILYTMKNVVVLCFRCCVLCWTALPMAVYARGRPPMQPGLSSTEPWVSE